MSITTVKKGSKLSISDVTNLVGFDVTVIRALVCEDAACVTV